MTAGRAGMWGKAHRWHPHQLRHTYATRIHEKFGLEEAQILLGHSKADVTQICAERDMGKAATVAAKIGRFLYFASLGGRAQEQ